MPMTDNDKLDVSTHIIFDMESEIVLKDEPIGVGKLYDYKISRNGATVVGQNGMLSASFLYFMNVSY